jgi:hypothetical protein
MYDYTEERNDDVRRYVAVGLKAEGPEWITNIVRGYCLEQIGRLMGPLEERKTTEQLVANPRLIGKRLH